MGIKDCSFILIVLGVTNFKIVNEKYLLKSDFSDFPCLSTKWAPNTLVSSISTVKLSISRL